MDHLDLDEDPEESEVDEQDLADQELFDEAGETEDVEDDAGIVRSEVVHKVLSSLLADAERGEGTLKRPDIDRAYLRRGLTIAECLEVESGLIREGIIISDLSAAKEEVAKDIFGRRRRQAYLTDEEERSYGRAIQLANRLAEQGGSSNPEHDARVLKASDVARSRFVDANIRWVWKLVRDQGHREHLAPEDLFQEGMIGLLRATETFDPEKGFRFKTYATWWIEQKMHRAMADGDRTVRLPVHIQERYRRIRRSEVKLTLLMGREPTTQELADAVGMNAERLAKLLWRVRATECREGDAPVGEGIPLMELIPDKQGPSPGDLTEAKQEKDLIAALLQTLTPREERVLRMRFGIGLARDYTLQQVGDQFEVTRERIRQIEAKALRKLKHPTRSRRLRGLLP